MLASLIVPVCAEDTMEDSTAAVAAECAVLVIVKTESLVRVKEQAGERAAVAVQKVVHRSMAEKKVVHVPLIAVLGVWVPV